MGATLQVPPMSEGQCTAAVMRVAPEVIQCRGAAGSWTPSPGRRAG